MKKILLVFINLITICFNVTAKDLLNNDIEYIYSDMNNNRYVLTKNSLIYIPVKPIQSSSGYYDGGSRKEKTITKSEYDEIVSIYEKAIKNKNELQQKREMLTGLLTIKDSNGRSVYIFKADSLYKKKIDNKLNEVLLTK